MGKLKDAHVFCNKEGSIAKFFVMMALFVAAGLTGEAISYAFMKEPLDWWGILIMYLCFAVVVTVIYFITRLLAYRTRIFPKTENREGIHGLSFIFLLLVSFILFVLFV